MPPNTGERCFAGRGRGLRIIGECFQQCLVLAFGLVSDPVGRRVMSQGTSCMSPTTNSRNNGIIGNMPLGVVVNSDHREQDNNFYVFIKVHPVTANGRQELWPWQPLAQTSQHGATMLDAVT